VGKLKIMWSILRSEKFICVYMIVSILIIIVTSNILFALSREAYILNRISDGCDFDHAVYFSRSNCVPFAKEETEYDRKVDDLLREMENNGCFIGTIDCLYTYVEAVQDYAFLMDYNETIQERLRLPLSQGRWFQEGVCNEAILSYEYKKKYAVGDKIPFTMTDAGGRHELELEVVGFLDKNNYLMNFTSSGYVDMSALIVQEKSAIITSGLEDIDGRTCEMGTGNGIMIFDPMSQNNSYNEKLMEFGAVTTMEEIADHYQENVRERLYHLVGINIVLFLLAFSGLGSMNFISLYTRRREYGIYFICGLSRRMVALITAMIDLTIMGAAFIPATIFCIFHPAVIPNFDVINVMVTIGVTGVILFVSLIPFFIITKKHSVIDLTRR